jgi:uncharacterized protein YjbI with pentapeptide repeats
MKEKLNTRDNPKPCKFLGCPFPALTLADYCWAHLPDNSEYFKELKRWIEDNNKELNKFILRRIDINEDIEGRYLLTGTKMKEADLIGARLQSTDLSNVDLEGALIYAGEIENAVLLEANLQEAFLVAANIKHTHLWKAKLQKANLTNSHLEDSHFISTQLQETILKNAHLQRANLSSANLNKADLRYSDLTGAKIDDNTVLTEANLAYATLTGVKTITKKNFVPEGVKDKLTEKEKKEAEDYKESYLVIKNYFLQTGRYEDASWAAYREKTLERIAIWNKYFKKYKELKTTKWWEKWLKHPIYWFKSLMRTIFSRWSLSRTFSLISGYGEKPLRPLASAVAIIASFATLFGLKGWVITDKGAPITRALDYLYFSGITFTTIGYGDMRPFASPAARMFAFLEGFIGVFIIALFVWTLSRRYSGR